VGGALTAPGGRIFRGSVGFVEGIPNVDVRVSVAVAAQSGRFPAGDGSTDMASDPRNRTNSHVATAGQSPRLRMKPAAPTTKDAGYVDGAWWPRSRDLSAELPTLFDGLAERLGAVRRLNYNLTEWDTTARRIDAADRSVRLGGYRYQGANTVDVTGSAGRRIILLVIPPETSAADARTVSLAAAGTDNVESVDTLLAGGSARTGIPRQRPNADDRVNGSGPA
jgi:hypothetical protein